MTTTQERLTFHQLAPRIQVKDWEDGLIYPSIDGYLSRSSEVEQAYTTHRQHLKQQNLSHTEDVLNQVNFAQQPFRLTENRFPYHVDLFHMIFWANPQHVSDFGSFVKLCYDHLGPPIQPHQLWYISLPHHRTVPELYHAHVFYPR